MTRRQKDLFPELFDGKKYVSDIPKLIAEWHPTLNKGVLPEDITYGSNTTVQVACHRYKLNLTNDLMGLKEQAAAYARVRSHRLGR